MVNDKNGHRVLPVSMPLQRDFVVPPIKWGRLSLLRRALKKCEVLQGKKEGRLGKRCNLLNTALREDSAGCVSNWEAESIGEIRSIRKLLRKIN